MAGAAAAPERATGEVPALAAFAVRASRAGAGAIGAIGAAGCCAAADRAGAAVGGATDADGGACAASLPASAGRVTGAGAGPGPAASLLPSAGSALSGCGRNDVSAGWVRASVSDDGPAAPVSSCGDDAAVGTTGTIATGRGAVPAPVARRVPAGACATSTSRGDALPAALAAARCQTRHVSPSTGTPIATAANRPIAQATRRRGGPGSRTAASGRAGMSLGSIVIGSASTPVGIRDLPRSTAAEYSSSAHRSDSPKRRNASRVASELAFA